MVTFEESIPRLGRAFLELLEESAYEGNVSKLAADLELNPSSVHRWITGENDMRMRVLCRALVLMGTDLAALQYRAMHPGETAPADPTNLEARLDAVERRLGLTK